MKVTVYSMDNNQVLSNKGHYPDNMIKFIFRKCKIEYDPDGLKTALDLYDEKHKDNKFKKDKDVWILESYFKDHMSLAKIGSKLGLTSTGVRRHIEIACRDLRYFRCYTLLIFNNKLENPKEMTEEEIRSIDIRTIDMISNRAYYALCRAKGSINSTVTLGDLTEYSLPQLLRIRNLGKECQKEIANAIDYYGLTFKHCDLPEFYENETQFHHFPCTETYCKAASYCKERVIQ